MDTNPVSVLLDSNTKSQQIPRRIVRIQGLLEDLDPRPCPFGPDGQHPLHSFTKKLSRCRRNLLAGARIARAKSERLDYLVLTVRYDKETGFLSANLKASVNRFVQSLHRLGFSFEYFRVVEPTAAGVVNHANLVIRWAEHPASVMPDCILMMNGRLVFSPRLVSALWERATLGTSMVVHSQPVFLDGSDTWQGTPEGLVSYLSKYLSKSVGESSYYVSHSRNWIPKGAATRWKELFIEYAVRYVCDRGYWHTDVSEVVPRWLSWVVWRSSVQTSLFLHPLMLAEGSVGAQIGATG